MQITASSLNSSLAFTEAINYTVPTMVPAYQDCNLLSPGCMNNINLLVKAG